MHEIIEVTYELLDELDNSDIIKNLIIYKNKVKNNKKLIVLINKGKEETDKYIIMDIKNKLYKNIDYKNYIKYYNELFYIVMRINNYYKKVVNDKVCGLCNRQDDYESYKWFFKGKKNIRL